MLSKQLSRQNNFEYCFATIDTTDESPTMFRDYLTNDPQTKPMTFGALLI